MGRNWALSESVNTLYTAEAAGGASVNLKATPTRITHGQPKMSVWVKATSVLGTPALRLILEYASRDPDTDANFSPEESRAFLYDLTDQTGHYIEMPQIAAVVTRLRIVSLPGNATDTLVSADFVLFPTR